MKRFRPASCWEAQLLQNTLLKEKVLQEKDGTSCPKSLQKSVQNSVNPFVRPSSTRSDEWVGFPALFLDCEDVTWQLISVNINRQTSDDIEVSHYRKTVGF